MEENSRRYFYGMKGLVDLFSDEVPNVSNPKELTDTEITAVTRYDREAHLTVSILPRCDQSI